MTTTEPGSSHASTEQFELFSAGWCARAMEMWDECVYPYLVEPALFTYSFEYNDTDTGAVCQWKTDRGRIAAWDAGKVWDETDCDFILFASHENWQKVAEGKLDPVAAIASKRIRMRKGPMAVVIKEAEACKQLLCRGHGQVPTAW